MIAAIDWNHSEQLEAEQDQSLRVLVVDDHAVYRRGMRTLLTTIPGIEIVGEASTGHDAVTLAGELRPDVAIMDLNMPGLTGIEATRRIKRCSPRTGILVIT